MKLPGSSFITGGGFFGRRGRVLVLPLAEGRDSFSSPRIRRQRMEKVKEATIEVATKLRPKKAPWVSLRETLYSEGFDDKHGWRRMAALLGAVNPPFCR
jgi:hypothetical protein